MKNIFISLILFLLSFCSSAQEKWTLYKAIKGADTVNCMAVFKNQIWLGTNDGLISCDTGLQNIKRYTTIDGLVDNKIKEIAIDMNGTLWIGTFNGLSVFDGKVWSNYKTGNSKLPNNNIFGISIDEQNNKWIYTEASGLIKVNQSGWTFIDIPGKNLFINKVDFDKNGNKWMASRLLGVIKYNDTNWKYYNTSNSTLSSNWIDYIALDTNGWPWIAATGVYRLGGDDTWKHYHSVNSNLSNDYIASIIIDKSNNVWVPTFDGKLNVFNGSTFSTLDELKADGSGNFIRSFLIDNQQKVWAAYAKSGILIKQGSKVIKFRPSYKLGIIDDRINSFAEDKFGNIWFATWNGVSKFDGKNWYGYDTSILGFPYHYITTVMADNSDTIWCAGLNEGISKFDGKTWTCYKYKNLGFGNILRAIKDLDGTLWFATFDNGMVSYKNGVWKNYTKSNSGILENGISSIAIDKEGKKWIGIGLSGSGLPINYIGGVSVFDGKNSWTSYHLINSKIPDKNVSCVRIDNQNRKWISTWGGGFVIFDGTQWTNFNSSNSGLSDNNIYTMAIDQNDIKWIGNWEGLQKYDNHTFKSYNNVFGTVVDILVDNSNHKWFATPDGAYMLDDTLIVNSINKSLLKISKSLVYPNPSNTVLNIQLAKEASIKQAIVTDLNGRIVIEITRDKILIVEIENLNQGIYTLTLTDYKGEVSKTRFIKN